MFVFAGNNGSGKSTIRNLIIDRIGVSANIDPDALARRINPTQPETTRVSAGKEAIRLAREYIHNHRDFSLFLSTNVRSLTNDSTIDLEELKERMTQGISLTGMLIGHHQLEIVDRVHPLESPVLPAGKMGINILYIKNSFTYNEKYESIANHRSLYL